MNFEKIYIIGEGRVAKICAKIAENFFKKEVVKIENESTKHLDEFFSKIKNSFIISANNFYIFKENCVKNNKIINYHNSLLPKHKGLNAHIWAIFEGDKKAGITWHKVETGIDTGEILAQKEIKLDKESSGLSLLRKQHDLAITSLKIALENFFANKTKINKGGGYHKKLPNDGFLELSWEEEKISRFLRAMQGSTKEKPKIKLLGQELEILFWEFETCIRLNLEKNINLCITKERKCKK